MKLFLIIGILISQISVFAHGGHMSTQTLTIQEDRVEMEFKIDVHTLEHYYQELFGNDFNSKKGFYLTKYINEKFNIEGTGELQFELLKTNQNKNYVVVVLEANWSIESISEICVSSDFFYEVDDHFENRLIVSKLNGESTSYRLTKENNKITARIR